MELQKFRNWVKTNYGKDVLLRVMNSDIEVFAVGFILDQLKQIDNSDEVEVSRCKCGTIVRIECDKCMESRIMNSLES